MVVYNNTKHIIRYKSPALGQILVLMAGANLNVSNVMWKDMQVSMKGHIQSGRISEGEVKKKTSVPVDAPDEVSVSESDLLKVIDETFDTDELEKIGNESKSAKVKKAVKAQIKKIEG